MTETVQVTVEPSPLPVQMEPLSNSTGEAAAAVAATSAAMGETLGELRAMITAQTEILHSLVSQIPALLEKISGLEILLSAKLDLVNQLIEEAGELMEEAETEEQPPSPDGRGAAQVADNAPPEEAAPKPAPQKASTFRRVFLGQ